ncbi:MAG TPA: sigma 54-interacting transcriptional regulator [Gemmataceae bacterium]|nr:sigma 54-interacting transcriptional regulator [Gemmataceae bacterium]
MKKSAKLESVDARPRGRFDPIMRAHLRIEKGDGRPVVCGLHPDRPAILGRSLECAVVLNDEHVSRRHAEITLEDGRWLIRDLDTPNGTRVDGQRIEGPAALEDGQEVAIGGVVLRFLMGSPPNGVPSSLSAFEELDYDPTGIIDPSAPTLHIDELNVLCRFMSLCLEESDAQTLIARALQIIYAQTKATIAGFLSFDPDEPLPKIVVPEAHRVNLHLSRHLTQRAQAEGQSVWLQAGPRPGQSTSESLVGFTDAMCFPLRAEGGVLGAVHVYKADQCFIERDLRFCEILTGHLADTLRLHRMRRTLEAENSRLRSHAPVSDEIIGVSPAIQNLRQLINRAAVQPFTVLIMGESGSGKELVALALHRQSPRRQGPLVVLNCAAIAPTLIEAELFGYRKGAFTGADRDHPGLFQQADEGTLFLDEIGELPMDCQAKLLRVIEGKGFRPVGATAEIKVDVRIVAATHRDLAKEVRESRFREDLNFRLQVIPIRVPPLREHAEDIPALVDFFLARLAVECRRKIRLTEPALRRLQSYSWPGNVRQLRSVLECSVALSDRDTLDAADLRMPDDASGRRQEPGEEPTSLDLEELETWAIRQALQRTGGNITQAAKILGCVRDTLASKIKKKGIDLKLVENP